MNRSDIIKRIREINKTYYSFNLKCSEIDDEINDVFFQNNEIYIGNKIGNPDYIFIGIMSELETILHRENDGEKSCDFIFDFGKYRVVITWDEGFMDSDDFDGFKLSLYNCIAGKWEFEYEWLKDSLKIESKIKDIISSE